MKPNPFKRIAPTPVDVLVSHENLVCRAAADVRSSYRSAGGRVFAVYVREEFRESFITKAAAMMFIRKLPAWESVKILKPACTK